MMLRAFLAQSILHALLAALVVETLLRTWRVGDAVWRLRFRTVALAAPLAWLPALFLFARFRSSPLFVARWALFAGERWNLVRVGPSGLGDLILLLAAGAGSALFLRDALPSLRDALRGETRPPHAEPWQRAAFAVSALAARHAASLGVPVPEVRVVSAAGPVLLCAGAREPALLVSPATLARLSPDELDAAVAHEVAHAAHRDPAWGFVLIAVRALLFFNPAAQWVARAVVDDIERRADQAVVRLTGRGEALATAIEALFDGTRGLPGDDASFERMFWRIRQEGLQRRCARLRSHAAGARLPHGRLQMALVVTAVLGLTFFVV